MPNPLARKLSTFIDLSAEDRRSLDVVCEDSRRLRAHTTLIKEGERPEQVFLLIDGWAFRYKMVDDGARQILAYLIPGDLCDPHIFILKSMDHNIGLLSDATVAEIPKQAIVDLTEERPRIAQAFWWSALVDEGVLREWLVNMGQRDAYERIAHLFCELWLRMDQVGLVDRGEFSLPLTQEQLGDTVGLTAVHVNRTLQRLRASGLVTVGNRFITIHDIEALKEVADFRPNYLHLERRRPDETPA